MLRRLLSIVLLALLMLAVTPTAAAQSDEDLSLQLDRRTFSAGERIRLEVVYTGTGEPSGVVWPGAEGLEYIGQSSSQVLRQAISGGRRITIQQVIHTIEVIAPDPGAFRIPAFSVSVDERTLTTEPVSIRIVEAPESQRLDMQVEVSTEQAFVGEPVLVTLRITSAYPLLKDNLEIITPAPRGAHTVVEAPATGGRVLGNFSMMGGEASMVVAETNIGGRRTQVYTARQYVIPEEPGTLEIPTFRVLGDLVLRRSRSVFERPRTRAVSSASAPMSINVRAVPTEGQPPGFTGLVGRVGVAMTASPERVNVGDPIELKVTVRTDIPRRLRALDLGAIDAFRDRFRISDEPEIRYGDNVAQFQWTIRPLDDGVEQIPALELPYFDTDLGRFGMARAPAVPLDVRATRRVTAADAIGAPVTVAGRALEDLEAGIAFNVETDAALQPQAGGVLAMMRSPVWIAAATAPPLGYAACAVLLAWRRRGEATAGSRRRNRALGEARVALRSASDAASVAGALSAYLGTMTDRPGAAITASDAEAILSPIDNDRAAALRTLLEQCDGARYAGATSADVSRMRDDAAALLEAVDGKLRRRGT
jgi:hypothetical protein